MPPAATRLSRKELAPDTPPPPKAKLLLGGVSVPVTARVARDGNRFTINLVTHDEVFESEEYVNTTDGFSVASIGVTEFEPPIPLLKFPLAVGQETWTWKGTLSADVEEHSANATITTASDTINFGLRPVDTIKVQVEIVFDSIGEGESAERQLTFWFQPMKGLIKRSVGATSAREPVES